MRVDDDILQKYVEAYYRRASEHMSRSEEFLQKRIREKMQEEELVGPSRVKELSALVGKLYGRRLLELGSGAGGISVSMAREGAIAVGLEPMWEGVVASRVRLSKYPDIRCLFVQGVGEQLPFRHSSFDLIVSYQVFEHVADIEQVVKETFRVLKPGGRFLHHIPNYLYPWEGHYRIFWVPLLPKSFGKLYAWLWGMDPRFLDTLNYSTPRAIRRIFSAVGFSDLRDLALEDCLAKFDAPEKFNRPIRRKLGHILHALGLTPVAKALFRWVSFYLCSILVGQKPRAVSHGAGD